MLVLDQGLESKLQCAGDAIAAIREEIMDIGMSLRELGGDPAVESFRGCWHRLIDGLADTVIAAETLF